MPAALFLRPVPRAFFLLTETHALVFRQPDASEAKASRSLVVAEFLPIDEVDTRGLVPASRGKLVDGVLGVTSVPTERSPIPEIFLLLISASSSLPPLLPGSSLRPSRVVGVEFHSLSSNFWDAPDILASSSSTFDPDYDDPYGSVPSNGSSTQSLAAQQGLENPCGGMRKYMESGGFFFAEECKWDISTRMGETNWIQAEKGITGYPLDTFDERFVWNANLLIPLLSFRSNLPPGVRQELDDQSLIIPVIQGFCGSLPVSTGAWSPHARPEVAALGMISRLSWKRAGARFRTRGIDDDGQVANFVETELILATDNVCLSYAQVRGSVPLFWQQPAAGIGTLQQKVEITRPAQATQPAFDKHFLGLLEHYHSVHAVNLLGQRDAESMLSAAYSDHLDELKHTIDQMPASEKLEMDAKPHGTLALTPYDFHASVRTSGTEGVKYDFSTGMRDVVASMENFGWTAVDTTTGQIIEQQNGVFRTNCLDCLDRTNYVQDVISSITLSNFLRSIESPLLHSTTLWAAHREIWADNGDRLSKIYAGTGALNTSTTRTGKKTFAGLLSDATKSVGRAYINNFQDKGKQAAIDMLLGMMSGQRPVVLFDPISDSVHSALTARINEFSRSRAVSIFVGTWNLNGKAPNESLNGWLFPPNAPDADIYAISFQEIVELTAGQILQTDPAKRRMWEKYIMDTFIMKFNGKTDYLLYRSEQLVGTSLIIVVKADITPHIRRVESATKKTGLQGLSGNKGGVGIRLELFDSSICLMTCHLAAGHSNVSERNADYRTISSGLRFLKGKTIEDHDITIWAADFNYRISLPNLEVRELIEDHAIDTLLASDQLLQAMDDGDVFHGYDEGPIRFLPTYKFDNGTELYDTSEKARIPAWTDRILFKGSALRLKDYNCAELVTSDHRPVYAIFDATVREVDEAKKDAIAKSILHQIRESEGQALDAKIEKATAVSGIGGLPERLAKTPISSIPRKPVPAMSTPKLPPRPNAVTDIKSTIPARPSVKKPSQTSQRPPPPIPNRAPSVNDINTLSSTPSKRAPPAVPSSGRSRMPSGSNRSSSPMQSGSPILTPASTGDYMIVTSPNRPSPKGPPLPPRGPPVTRPSLDMNGAPPEGLPQPVKPDTISILSQFRPSKSPPPIKPKPVTVTSPIKKAPPSVPQKPVALRSTSGGGP